MLKRLWVGLAVMGSVGPLTVIVLTIMEGFKYRIREEQGLDPIWAPAWVSGMTVAGFWVFVASGLALIVVANIARVRKNRRTISSQ